MHSLAFGFGGLFAAGAAAWLLWLRTGPASRNPARMARRVELELKSLGLDSPEHEAR